MTARRGGPLSGMRIVEIAGLGAAPYGCMMLADMGADVVRIERLGGGDDTPASSPLLRNRRSIALHLKKPEAIEIVLALAGRADALVEALQDIARDGESTTAARATEQGIHSRSRGMVAAESARARLA